MTQDIASIGFSVDTSGIERGAVALDVLASKGAEVDKAVSQIEGATARAKKSLDTLGQSARDGAGLGDVGKSAAATASGMDAAGKAAERSAVGVKRSADMFGLFGGDVRKAAEALGLYDSSTKKVIDHQKELAQILDRANPAAAAARKMVDEVQTLNRALREGAIGNDTYRTSMRNVFDEAEKAAGGVSKVGSTASMVTGLLTKLAGAAAVAFSFGKFISETIAAEQAQAQLQAVLKSTGESAGWTSQQLNAMAQGLASKSVFSVDQIKAAETRLLSYTGIVGEQFPRAMQAVVDMSSRMGMDVTSAAEQIGRALDIPSQGLTALTRQGFRFTEEQKELVKQLEETGRVAEAQAIVLSAVESSYGGAAEAARGTLGGALKELQKSINDLMTGDSSVPALTAGVDALTNIVKNAGAVLGEMKVSTDGVAGSISAAALVGNGFSILLETVAVLAVNVAYVLSGVGREIGGIAAQGAALMRFDLTAAAAIRREMVSDAEAARKAVDQTTQNILNARARLAEKPAINIGAPNAETMAKGAAEAQEKALAAATNARSKAMNDLLGVNQQYQAKLTELQGLEKSGALTNAEYVQAVSKLATATYNATDAGKAAAEASKARGKASDEAAKAAEREAQSYTGFVNSIREKIAAQELELAGGDKLSQSQKVRLQLEKMIADGKLASSRASSEELKTDLDRLKANELEIAGRKAAIDAVNSQRAAYIALSNEAATQNKSIESGNTSLREQIATMGLTNQQIRARTIELNRATIAEKEQQLARLQSGFTTTREQAALEEEIRLLKERNGLLSDQGVKEQYVAAQQEMTDTWTSIDRTAHDVFVNIFEDGAGTFKRLGQTLKSALLDMLYQLTVKRWIINIGASFGATGGIFGEGHGGAGGLLGMLSGTGGNIGALSGAFGGSMSWANAAGSIYANITGTGIDGLLATNGAYGTAGGGGLAGSAAAGIAAIAAPLIIGSIIERNSRDRFSGAAYATSGGNDPFVKTVAGSTSFDYLTGDLPDRAALMARLEELGAPMEAISDWNDRALLRLMESAAADNSEFGINWTSRVRDMRDTPDFYRGAGYAHPEELGWWHNKDNANMSTDPALIQASRDIALSIIGPLEGIGALIGDEAAYRATVGFANRGEGNGLWAGMNLQRDGQNVADWVNTDDFHSVGEAVRAMYSTALGALDSFDLPGWADKQVTDARAALDALEGENMGQEAAALYAQTTAGIEQMYRSIQMLIDVFPDFSDATQDSVFALQELMGGMDQLQGAYSSYLQNFWSDEERADLMRKQIGLELGKVGLSLPETRDAFRDLVEAQDLSTEAGREAFAALMGVAGAFAEITPAAESAAEAAAHARERIDSIFGQLSKLWDEQISNWSKLSSEAKSVFDVAIKAAKDLRGQVADTRLQDARTANAYIDQALAGLRATGALPDSKELADAIAAARGGLDMSQYDTVAEYERDQLILAGKLNEIGDSAEVQMSFAEQQVQLLEQQRDYWRQQIDLLTATGETITSIDQGIEYLADYVREQAVKEAAKKAAEEAAREAARRDARRGDFGGGGGRGQTYSGTPPTMYARDEDEIADAVARYAALGLRSYAYQGPSGTWSVSPGQAPYDETRLRGLRQYASGGYYPGGLAMVGERGPELINFENPGQVYNAWQTRDMMRGGDNAELVAELRELRARLDKIERNTAVLPQTHDVIDRVTAGGNAMLTEAA